MIRVDASAIKGRWDGNFQKRISWLKSYGFIGSKTSKMMSMNLPEAEANFFVEAIGKWSQWSVTTTKIDG